MFVDYVKIFVEAGRGGNGCISFQKRYKQRGSPDGGNGGRGGDIIIKTDKSYKTLYDLTLKRYFKAESGKHGGSNNKTGKAGRDLIIKVPIGTYIYDAHTKEVLGDLIKDDQEVVVAKGGRGGLGNAFFKSSREHALYYFAQKGIDGEKRSLILELKLIADVGIIGYPNVGKSSLLTRLTNARPVIADYPFTTKQPILGVLESGNKTKSRIVIADIPGLIEGAHRGAGLGRLFLRHIERTKLLIHLLDGTQEDIYKNYLALNEELRLYNPSLINKPQLIVVNKIDQPKARYNLEYLREKLSKEILAISTLNAEGLNYLIEKIEEKVLDEYSINK